MNGRVYLSYPTRMTALRMNVPIETTGSWKPGANTHPFKDSYVTTGEVSGAFEGTISLIYKLYANNTYVWLWRF